MQVVQDDTPRGEKVLVPQVVGVAAAFVSEQLFPASHKLQEL